MCPRINKKNHGYRPIWRCYWFSMFYFWPFLAFLGIFGHFSTLVHQFFNFLLFINYVQFVVPQNQQKNRGYRPIWSLHWRCCWFCQVYVWPIFAVFCHFWAYFHPEHFWTTYFFVDSGAHQTKLSWQVVKS